MLHASLSSSRICSSGVFGKLREAWETLMGHFCLGEERLIDHALRATHTVILALEISLHNTKLGGWVLEVDLGRVGRRERWYDQKHIVGN